MKNASAFGALSSLHVAEKKGLEELQLAQNPDPQIATNVSDIK